MRACSVTIDPGRAHDADRIEAGVLEEMFILGGQHRVHHHLGNIVEVHDAPLLALAVEQIGDQLRLQMILGALGLIAQGNDLRDCARLES